MTHDQMMNQLQNAAIVAGNEDFEKEMRTGWLEKLIVIPRSEERTTWESYE